LSYTDDFGLQELLDKSEDLLAAELIAEMKRYVPEYCRIMRVQRDIPTYTTSAGVDRTNLRQYVHRLMKKKGIYYNFYNLQFSEDF